MRAPCRLVVLALASLTVLATACSVPEKQPASGDGGVDGMTPDGDPTQPDTMITMAPEPFSRFSSAMFRFSSNLPNATFECSFDDETPIPCTTPYTRSLGDGAHTFSVRAIGSDGTEDMTPAEHLWMIDTVAPQTQLTETPPAADNSTMVRFSFTSNEDNVTFDCALDGGTYVPCVSGAMFGPLGDGSHAFSVRAHDRAGNVDASPAIYAWSVDTSTPDTQLMSGPEGAVSATTATFTFGSQDAGAGATFECALDGAAFTPCTSPAVYANLGEGEHLFAVRVKDAVGNFDPTPAMRSWTVDLSAPETTLTGGPSGTTRLASATFTFTSNEPNVTFACSLDEAPFAACTSPHNIAGLGQGAHTFAVRAIDMAGHPDLTPASRTWTVDSVAPTISITSGPATGSTSGPRVVFVFTVNEGDMTCSIDDAPFTACASPLAFNAPAGAHTFRVRASDAAGNVATTSRSWAVACAAPDATGATALLHLDDTGQVLANAVAGGASALLGTTDMVEASDPAFVPGRFGTALAFTAADSDVVTWPVALGAMTDVSIELWARPDAAAGSRDLLTSGDGRLALRVVAASPTTVQLTFTVVEAGGTARVATSAPVAANAWHHVIATLDDPALRLWVDGVRTDAAVELGAGPTLDALQLGGSGGAAYEGSLDEVWVAQTAFADDEAALTRYCPAP
ncbi:MAG: LamG domain-containing protein [Myxococcota bacterium]|nr:LamG domain-containing protein [Myxococcota bacterium]